MSGHVSKANSGKHPTAKQKLVLRLRTALLCGVIVLASISPSSQTTAQPADTKPYDEQLLRLSEILGAMHFLRELCSANDGTLWRDKMQRVLEAEGATALRRARLTRRFNKGYQSYQRTYATCTRTAQSSIARFLAEGVKLSENLFKTAP